MRKREGEVQIQTVLINWGICQLPPKDRSELNIPKRKERKIRGVVANEKVLEPEDNTPFTAEIIAPKNSNEPE